MQLRGELLVWGGELLCERILGHSIGAGPISALVQAALGSQERILLFLRNAERVRRTRVLIRIYLPRAERAKNLKSWVLNKAKTTISGLQKGIICSSAGSGRGGEQKPLSTLSKISREVLVLPGLFRADTHYLFAPSRQTPSKQSNW